MFHLGLTVYTSMNTHIYKVDSRVDTINVRISAIARAKMLARIAPARKDMLLKIEALTNPNS